MNRKQCVSVVALALVAGLVGGVVSTQLFVGKPAFAEKKPPHEKVLRAERFLLVDKDGKMHGVLAVDENSSGFHPTLSLVDNTGMGRLTLTLDSSGSPSLYMHDKKGKCRVALFGEAEELSEPLKKASGIFAAGPAFTLYDKQGCVSASLFLGPDGCSSVVLSDPSRAGIFGPGHRRIGFYLTQNGMSIGLYKHNQMRAELGLDADGEPSFKLFDKLGTHRAVLGTTQLKNTQTGSIETRAPSSLVLFDEGNKVLWSAP